MPVSTSERQDRSFLRLAAEKVDIDDLVETILGRDASWVIQWASEEFSPEEIFDNDILDEWATSHGYTKNE